MKKRQIRLLIISLALLATILVTIWGMRLFHVIPNVAIDLQYQWIAFSCNEPGNNYPFSRLYVVRSDGTNLQLVAENSFPLDYGGFRYPAWSPDGSQLAYSYSDRIYIINTDGTHLHSITDPSLSSFYSPSWYPNGTRLVILSKDLMPQIAEGIYSITSTGEALELIHTQEYVFDVKISPDGSWIAYTSDRELYIIRPDGSQHQQLMAGVELSKPSWSPDGRQIAFLLNPRDEEGTGEDRGIYTINIDGTELTPIITERDIDILFNSALRITIHDPAWSSDGQSIAFSGGGYENSPAGLYRVDIESGEVNFIVRVPECDEESPAWSPLQAP